MSRIGKANKINVTGESKPKIKILWTGGWDSTFRIVSLADKNVIIEPIYLLNNRKCEPHELHAINTIANELKKSKSTKFTLNKLKTIKSSDVKSDKNITDGYKNLADEMHLGGQYEWLARFANLQAYKGIELSIHKDDKAYKVIKAFGKVKKVSKQYGSYYELDINKSHNDLVKVFGNFKYPLFNLNKKRMKRLTDYWGYSSIMTKTWFCHDPFNDEPCGICMPCIYSMEEGMSYRFSEEAIIRYNKLRKLGRFKFYRKLKELQRTFLTWYN